MKRNILELRSEEIKLYMPENEIKEQILSMGFEWKDWYLHQIYRPIEIVDNYWKSRARLTPEGKRR